VHIFVKLRHSRFKRAAFMQSTAVMIWSFSRTAIGGKCSDFGR
jgi:hypothetical protein